MLSALMLNPAAYDVDGAQQDGQVASRLTALSAVTQPNPMHGPDNIQLFQTGSYPERDDGPQWSIEQGVGRSPGQQWPHMPHVEQFSDEGILGIGWHDGSAAEPHERGERQGWALPGPQGGPLYYYGNSAAQHVVGPEPVLIQDAGRMPYQDLAQVPA